MIRPLGLVTLYFGYAEYELDYGRNRATDLYHAYVSS